MAATDSEWRTSKATTRSKLRMCNITRSDLQTVQCLEWFVSCLIITPHHASLRHNSGCIGSISSNRNHCGAYCLYFTGDIVYVCYDINILNNFLFLFISADRSIFENKLKTFEDTNVTFLILFSCEFNCS